MTNNDGIFFSEKKTWSTLKDRILANYLPPYLKKVACLRNRIVLVDAFSGPGIYGDNKFGSPMIIRNAAEQYVPNNYTAIFVNKNIESHSKLNEALKNEIQSKKIITIKADAAVLLDALKENLTDQTLFIYLDPFGIKGCEFKTLEPYLLRGSKVSTELLIRLDVSTMHRLSCCDAILGGFTGDHVTSKHKRLTEVLGGEYWKDYLLDKDLTPIERIKGVLLNYRKLLSKYLPQVGSCPVPSSTKDSTIKYFITFASRHVDASLLMNDIMHKAYWEQVSSSLYENTIFTSQNWEDYVPNRNKVELKECILNNLNGKRISRQDLWIQIVGTDFMKYRKSDFIKAVAELNEVELEFEDVKGTGKLNDQSILKLKGQVFGRPLIEKIWQHKAQ